MERIGNEALLETWRREGGKLTATVICSTNSALLPKVGTDPSNALPIKMLMLALVSTKSSVKYLASAGFQALIMRTYASRKMLASSSQRHLSLPLPLLPKPRSIRSVVPEDWGRAMAVTAEKAVVRRVRWERRCIVADFREGW